MRKRRGAFTFSSENSSLLLLLSMLRVGRERFQGIPPLSFTFQLNWCEILPDP